MIHWKTGHKGECVDRDSMVSVVHIDPGPHSAEPESVRVYGGGTSTGCPHPLEKGFYRALAFDGEGDGPERTEDGLKNYQLWHLVLLQYYADFVHREPLFTFTPFLVNMAIEQRYTWVQRWKQGKVPAITLARSPGTTWPDIDESVAHRQVWSVFDLVREKSVDTTRDNWGTADGPCCPTCRSEAKASKSMVATLTHGYCSPLCHGLALTVQANKRNATTASRDDKTKN